jgi:hypothetical protein
MNEKLYRALLLDLFAWSSRIPYALCLAGKTAKWLIYTERQLLSKLDVMVNQATGATTKRGPLSDIPIVSAALQTASDQSNSRKISPKLQVLQV